MGARTKRVIPQSEIIELMDMYDEYFGAKMDDKNYEPIVKRTEKICEEWLGDKDGLMWLPFADVMFAVLSGRLKGKKGTIKDVERVLRCFNIHVNDDSVMMERQER